MSKTKAQRKQKKITPYNELTFKVAAVWTRVSSEEQRKRTAPLTRSARLARSMLASTAYVLNPTSVERMKVPNRKGANTNKW